MAQQPKQKGPGSARGLEVAERRQKVLELRKRGMTVEAISRLLKVSADTVKKDVQRSVAAIAGRLADLTQEVVTVNMERTEALLLAIYPRAVGTPERGVPNQPGHQPAKEPNLDAAHTVLAIIDRQNRMLGIGATGTMKHVGADGGAIKVEDARSQLTKALEKLADGDVVAREVEASLQTKPDGG